jgi:sialic acid synthase SpsE
MKTFVVAEIGTNFLNDPEIGRALICDAACAGADAIKTQLYKADHLAAVDSPLYWEGTDRSQREAFEKLDKLSLHAHRDLLKFAQALGLVAYSTPFDLESVDVLESWGVQIFKIASADITYHELLRRVAQTGRPIHLSTGASTMAEVAEAIGVLMEEGTTDLTLLGCTLTYPCPIKDANLSQLNDLAQFGFPIGYSDHTTDVLAPSLAVAMGATVIEKHMGDPLLSGADNGWALGSEAFKRMVSAIRLVETAVGTAGKTVLPSEEKSRLLARRSLATLKDVRPGEMVDESTVTALRPGTGIPAWEFSQYKGRVFTQIIPAGMLLTREMFR